MRRVLTLPLGRRAARRRPPAYHGSWILAKGQICGSSRTIRMHVLPLEPESRKIRCYGLAPEVFGHQIRGISVPANLDHLDLTPPHGVLEP